MKTETIENIKTVLKQLLLTVNGVECKAIAWGSHKSTKFDYLSFDEKNPNNLKALAEYVSPFDDVKVSFKYDELVVGETYTNGDWEHVEKNDNIILLKTFCELKLLDYSGFRPNASRCIVCGDGSSLGNYFAPQEGGRVCISCMGQVNIKYRYDSTTFRLIEYIQNNHISRVLEAKISRQIIEELSGLLDYYIKFHLSEIRLKTREYLILD